MAMSHLTGFNMSFRMIRSMLRENLKKLTSPRRLRDLHRQAKFG